MMRSAFLAFLLLGFVCNEAASQQSSVADPEDVIEQLAFLEGKWTLTSYIYNEDGSVAKQSSAKMKATSVFGGRGILEERVFPDNESGANSYDVMMLYTVKPTERKIVGVLNNTLGNRKVLDQTSSGDAMVFEMRGELFGDRSGYARIRYENITNESFELVQDYCPGGDKPCRERVFSFTAIRVKD